MFGGLNNNPFAGMLANAMDPRFGMGAPPEAYEAHFKAYSMAMLPRENRDNVTYGGKIIMPPSALQQLNSLEIPSPWQFEIFPVKVKQPKTYGGYSVNDAVDLTDDEPPPPIKTHAGVLEFIADEGNVHFPPWMMRALDLQEGDPVRLKGCKLPQGLLVKFQAQTADFLELSDPKAVLEQAMRNYSTLTPGDIIEIHYNCIQFELLVMEISPDADAIDVTETDLEVDFAAPKGYVEPAPKPKEPVATMASKLKINPDQHDSIPPTRTGTPMGSTGGGSSKGEDTAEVKINTPFSGTGQSLSGRKSKKKNDKGIEQLDPFSMVRRTDQPRIVTNDTQLSEKNVPAALNLEFGQLFFGYEHIPVGGKDAEKKEKGGGKQITFSGAGTTLSGRAPRPRTPPPVKEEDDDIQMMGQTLGGGGGGGGRTLGSSGGGSSGALKRKKTGGKSLNERDVEMEEVIELD